MGCHRWPLWVNQFRPLTSSIAAPRRWMLDAERTQGRTDPDDAPEPPAHPVAEPGDLWVQRCGSPVLFDRVKKLGLLAYRELDDCSDHGCALIMAIATLAPSRANRMAVARPIPVGRSR